MLIQLLKVFCLFLRFLSRNKKNKYNKVTLNLINKFLFVWSGRGCSLRDELVVDGEAGDLGRRPGPQEDRKPPTHDQHRSRLAPLRAGTNGQTISGRKETHFRCQLRVLFTTTTTVELKVKIVICDTYFYFISNYRIRL